MNNDYEQIDLEIALKKLHQLQLEDGGSGNGHHHDGLAPVNSTAKVCCRLAGVCHRESSST